MKPSFDPSPYDSLPQLNVQDALALIQALDAAPHDALGAPAQKALDRARVKGEALRALYEARPVPQKGMDLRLLDTRLDASWGALSRFLWAHGELNDAFAPNAALARALHATLFRDGLTFLRLPYRRQWVESRTILTRIDADALEPKLAALGGAAFLAQIKAAHEAYGRALDITEAPEAQADPAPLLEPLRELLRAIATYARLVTGAALNEDIPEDAALEALRPIQTVRTTKARRWTEDAPARDEATPPAEPTA